MNNIKKEDLWVTVVDPHGATYGYDGSYVEMKHRLLFTNNRNNVVGYECIPNDCWTKVDAVKEFLTLVLAYSDGCYNNRLVWKWEQ